MPLSQPQSGPSGWSTLEVVRPQYSQLEVAADSRLPQAIQEQVGKEVCKTDAIEVTPVPCSNSNTPLLSHNDANQTQSSTGHASAERHFLRRRRTWLLLCTVILVILGVVLGVVFGVVLRRQGNGDSPPSSTPGEDSRGNGDPGPTSGTSALRAIPKCATSFCPQSLKGLVESYTAVDQSPAIHLLARDRAGDIQHISSASGGRSFPDEWRSYGASGFYPDSLASTFLSINGRHSISFFGVVSSSPNMTWDHVAYRTIDLANRTVSSPIYLRDGNIIATNAPAVCAPANSGMAGSPPTDMSVFNKAHFTQDRDGGIWWRFSHGTPGTFHDKYVHQVNDIGYNTMPNAPPGIACRDGPVARYDVMAYTNATDNFIVYHKWFDFGIDKWSGWHKAGGPFRLGSRPILVEVSKDRFDFFGVGTDDAIHHFNFEQQGEKYSDMESLGGSFASNAAGAAMGAGRDRIDVVAINKGDEKLKREHWSAPRGTRNGPIWVRLLPVLHG